jgi:hypothetical protein
VPGCPDERIRNSGRGPMVDLPTVYAATVTTATWLLAGGTNSPASRRPSIWNSMASRIAPSASSRVSPVAATPGRSGA